MKDILHYTVWKVVQSGYVCLSLLATSNSPMYPLLVFSLRLEKFPIVAPIGMQRSTIRMGSNATVKWAEMTVTWTPSVNQYGQNVFCFEASDSTG